MIESNFSLRIKSFVKDQIAKSAYLTGLSKISLTLSKNKILILGYHRVTDQEGNEYISTKNFEGQMHYLSQNYSFVSLSEVIAHIKEGSKLPPNPVVVTFDDGYKDVYKNAYPILEKYKIPATIFLTVNYIETGEMPWWDKINYMFTRTKEKRFTWSLYETKEYSFQDYSERISLAKKIRKELKWISEERKNELIENLSKQFNVKIPKQEGLMLSWNEIREMAENGILFGAHTLTHPILTKISKEQVKYEIIESKKILEQKIGVSIDHFAYPNGSKSDFDSEIKEIVKKAGYTCACSCIRELNTFQTNLYELRRGHPSMLFRTFKAGREDVNIVGFTRMFFNSQ